MMYGRIESLEVRFGISWIGEADVGIFCLLFVNFELMQNSGFFFFVSIYEIVFYCRIEHFHCAVLCILFTGS